MKQDKNIKWMKLNLWKNFFIIIIFLTMLWVPLTIFHPNTDSRIPGIILYIFLMSLIIPILYFKVPLEMGISNNKIIIRYNRTFEKISWDKLKYIRLGEEGWNKPITIIQFRNGKHYYFRLPNEMIDELKNRAKCKLI